MVEVDVGCASSLECPSASLLLEGMLVFSSSHSIFMGSGM